MKNTIINQVTEHKHLGLEISSWKKNIDLITKETFTKVNIVREFKFILYKATSDNFLSYLHSANLEYVDVIWDNKTLF